jgi:hypothetical protein
MNPNEAAIKVDMLTREIEEIQLNMESVSARLANVGDGPARTMYEGDIAEMKVEIAAREKDLADMKKITGGGGS